MARRGGIFQALGSLLRVVIWGLAAVLVLAIWLSWGKNETETAGLPETEASDEGVAVIEIAPEAPGGATEDTAQPEAAETAATGVTEAAEAGAEAGADDLAKAGDTVLDDLEAVAPEGAAALAMPADLTVAGDPATYRFLGLSRTEDGMIEVATAKQADGATTFETRRVGCAPLATGLVASGDSEEALGQRNEAPEMVEAVAGDAVAAIAAAACEALKGETN